MIYPLFEYKPEDVWNGYCKNLGIPLITFNEKNFKNDSYEDDEEEEENDDKSQKSESEEEEKEKIEPKSESEEEESDKKSQSYINNKRKNNRVFKIHI
jgi:FtsZ-interacting cell division protein YlmF